MPLYKGTKLEGQGGSLLIKLVDKIPIPKGKEQPYIKSGESVSKWIENLNN